LAGARGRGDENVDAAEGVRQDELLNWERRCDAAALERAHNACAHAERGERFLDVFTPCPAGVEIEKLERLERRNEKPISRRRWQPCAQGSSRAICPFGDTG